MQITIKTDTPQSLQDYCFSVGIEVADTGNNGAKKLFIYETDPNKLAAIIAKLSQFNG